MYIATVSRILIAIFIFCSPLLFTAQSNNIDTLLYKATDLLYDNTNKTIELSNQVLQLSEDERHQFDAYYLIGEANYVLGDFEESLKYYRKSQKIAERLKDEFLLSKSFLGIGTTHDDNGDPEKGLELYFKALEIREKLGNKEDLSSILNNIAVSYHKLDKLKKAIEYMRKCASIDRELKDSTGLGYSYSNLGAFLYFDNQNDSAIYYHTKALNIRIELGENLQTARSLNNIANVYIDKKEIDLAIDYYKQAVTIKRTLGNPYELAGGLSNLGSALTNHNRPREALSILEEAREIFKIHDNKNSLKDNLFALAKTYSILNRNDSAYSILIKAYELNKEIFNDTKSEQIEEMVAKFETEKTEKENEELKAQRAIDALENAELKSQRAQDELSMEKSKNRNYLLIGSVLILLLVAGIILTRLRANKRTTNMLQGLNNQLEEKNSDITDSIQYAKRIQQALLPNKQELSQCFNEAFVLFMPRDIVSGDFYWLHEQGNKVFFAVADCTGHGVPGAFVSVLCNNLLGHSVSEHGLTIPGEILTDVNNGITKRLRKENASHTMMDGMDISLCVLNKETNELQFSGAMNPVIIHSKNKLIEYKGTKESIGGLNHGGEFKTINHQLIKGDMIYLFSDGYQDQFGGSKGKKFKYKNLKEKIQDFSDKDLSKQHDILKKLHLEWRGELEQLDDVCVMGIRV